MTEQRRSAVLVKSIDHCYRSVEATGLKTVIRMNVYFVEEKGRKRKSIDTESQTRIYIYFKLMSIFLFTQMVWNITYVIVLKIRTFRGFP